MLIKPHEMSFQDKKISIIVGGVAGIGKTTFACSAPKPLLIDLDEGVDRVEAQYRVDTLRVGSYAELISDLTNVDLSAYETLVIDTGGKLLELLKPVVINEDAKNGKRNGDLSLQGYGAIKRKFRETHEFLKTFKKHIVFIFHATEVALANDVTGLRIRMEGSSKDEIWDSMDLGCFMEIEGNKRVIGFSNCERYYAKGTHGIVGKRLVPTLEKGAKNNALEVIFNQYLDNLQKENEECKKYKKAMSIKGEIEKAQNVDDLNQLYSKISNQENALTSKVELWFALTERAKELGAVYDKSKNIFNNTVAS